jgi:hypothetical protein
MVLMAAAAAAPCFFLPPSFFVVPPVVVADEDDGEGDDCENGGGGVGGGVGRWCGADEDPALGTVRALSAAFLEEVGARLVVVSMLFFVVFSGVSRDDDVGPSILSMLPPGAADEAKQANGHNRRREALLRRGFDLPSIIA